MRTQSISRWIVVTCVIAITSCSKVPATAPLAATPAPEPSEFWLDARFTFDEGGYTVHDLEYADANGVLRRVTFHPPVWNTTVRLKPGDRLYLRAVVEYQGIIAGGLQISRQTPAGFYRGEPIGGLNGPETVVLLIDERVK